MNHKAWVYSTIMALISTVVVLGLVWVITGIVYQDPPTANMTKDVQPPPEEFEGKYTMDSVASKLGTVVISQSTTLNSVQEDVSVLLSINGELMEFEGAGPIITQGLTMIPIREVFGKLGFEITWNEETKSISVINEADKIVFTIGQMLYLRNDEPYMLDAPVQIINGKAMAPLRAVIDCLNAEFKWSELENLISFTVNR